MNTCSFSLFALVGLAGLGGGSVLLAGGLALLIAILMDLTDRMRHSH